QTREKADQWIGTRIPQGVAAVWLRARAEQNAPAGCECLSTDQPSRGFAHNVVFLPPCAPQLLVAAGDSAGRELLGSAGYSSGRVYPRTRQNPTRNEATEYSATG